MLDKILNRIWKNQSYIIKVMAVIIILMLSLILYDSFTLPGYMERLQKDVQFLVSMGFVIIGTIAFLLIPDFLTRNESSEMNHAGGTKTPLLRLRMRVKAFKKRAQVAEFNNLVSILIPMEDDILRHISKLQRNSIVNLMIGITGTVASIGILSLTILSTHIYIDFEKFALNFFPRLSFAIFIQLFSFFFLRLYKSNLEDSKYFQNELTNIRAKTTAIKIAFRLDDNSLLSELIRDLSRIERNFKLTSGETLLNLEKAKIEKDFDLELIRKFNDILKSQKSE